MGSKIIFGRFKKINVIRDPKYLNLKLSLTTTFGTQSWTSVSHNRHNSPSEWLSTGKRRNHKYDSSVGKESLLEWLLVKNKTPPIWFICEKRVTTKIIVCWNRSHWCNPLVRKELPDKHRSRRTRCLAMLWSDTKWKKLNRTVLERRRAQGVSPLTRKVAGKVSGCRRFLPKKRAAGDRSKWQTGQGRNCARKVMTQQQEVVTFTLERRNTTEEVTNWSSKFLGTLCRTVTRQVTEDSTALISCWKREKRMQKTL